MKMPELQTLEIPCSCGDKLHNVTFEYDDEHPDYISIFPMLISERSFFKRLLVGLRYIFNIRGLNDWYYTDIVIETNMLDELTAFIEQFNTDRDAYWDARSDDDRTYTPIRGFTRRGHE